MEDLASHKPIDRKFLLQRHAGRWPERFYCKVHENDFIIVKTIFLFLTFEEETNQSPGLGIRKFCGADQLYNCFYER